MDNKREDMIEEEAFLITRSGEIPEVAYHSSLHYLQEDPEGPGMDLTEAELIRLKDAVVQRYRWITLRDLRPENRAKRIYRGIKRSIINFQRLKTFSSREGLDIDDIIKEVRERLIHFLEVEVEECLSTNKDSVINCTYGEIVEFASSLGIEPKMLPEGLERLCRSQQRDK